MSHRVHNFSAGPGALPLPVLQQAQRDMTDFQGSGMSIMESSHRWPLYDQVHSEAIEDLSALLGLSDDFQVLFMGGGARTQFALVPMNLLAGGMAAYVTTGRWAQGALSEGGKVGKAIEIYSSAASNHNHVPQPGDLSLSADTAYLHYTSNNTVYGTQFHHLPEAGDVPLVCDMSSDILSRVVDVSRFALIYAGAQKNMGPAGVTCVIVRRDMLERCPDAIAETFNYRRMAAKNSLLNTPPVFPIYMVGLVAKHLLSLGGLEAVQAVNEHKAELLYRTIDNSGGFFRGHAREDSRSRMNVTFRLPSSELEAEFVASSEALDMVGLKGHASVGGLRASIYNSVPLDSVKELVSFMEDFQASRG
jgi:phosphoserine aminotransferase